MIPAFTPAIPPIIFFPEEVLSLICRFCTTPSEPIDPKNPPLDFSTVIFNPEILCPFPSNVPVYAITLFPDPPIGKKVESVTVIFSVRTAQEEAPAFVDAIDANSLSAASLSIS
jgi:hypothetical protein